MENLLHPEPSALQAQPLRGGSIPRPLGCPLLQGGTLLIDRIIRTVLVLTDIWLTGPAHPATSCQPATSSVPNNSIPNTDKHKRNQRLRRWTSILFTQISILPFFRRRMPSASISISICLLKKGREQSQPFSAKTYTLNRK